MGDRCPASKRAAAATSAPAVGAAGTVAAVSAESSMGKSLASPATGKGKKKSTKERWLLTRKTWRYMADAGRKLIPDGAHNRQEDIPKIESYFQHVCRKEPRFLLWRKSSYPGALGFRSHTRRNRNRNKGGSYREKVCSSADEAEDIAQSMAGMTIVHTTSGKFDVQRLRKEFLQGPSSSLGPSTSTSGDPSTSGFTPSPGTSTELSEKPERPKSFLQKLTRMKSTSSSKSPVESPIEPQSPPQSPPTESERGAESPESEDSDQKELIETLTRYLHQEQDYTGNPNEPRRADNAINFHELLHQLRVNLASEYSSQRRDAGTERHHHGGVVSTRSNITPSVHVDGDHQQQMLLDTLNRYFGKTTSREKMISDLLTDRKLLDKLYSDLRRVRGSRGRSTGLPGSSGGSWLSLHAGRRPPPSRDVCGERETDELEEPASWKRLGRVGNLNRREGYVSPPPLIQVLEDEVDAPIVTREFGTQTEVIPATMAAAIEEQLQKARELAREEEAGMTSPGGTSRRRSSVDHDDVSPSVSDTIKRYLRMARKKSLDSDKADRFKRVNYDRNLRNIKPKGEITKPGDDDGLHKGSQTDESWIDAMKELKLDDIVVEKEVDGGLTSPPKDKDKQGILSSGQSFLSNLLHGLQHHQSGLQQASGGGGSGGSGGSGANEVAHQAIAMHKSKSSSSVIQQGLVQQGRTLVANKIGWKTRSKSQQRNSTPSVWTPQGHCMWSNVAGRHVTLTDTSLVELSDTEAKLLQKVAMAKLQALNLGTNVKIPSESTASSQLKPKRRAYLLKRKALTTGFFDAARNKDEKCGGFVFGIPLSQCLENDRAQVQSRASPTSSPPAADDNAACSADLRRRSHHGSRTSFSSLSDQTTRADEFQSGTGSCESLAPAGLLDTLSCSTLDISSGPEREGAIPHIVQACLRHLEAFGLNTLGLFRISSSKKKVRQLREEIDCGKEFVMTEETCPHVVATLLKEFFRDLPDPLLCRHLYHAFVQTQRIRNRRLQQEALQHLVQLLPVPNRDTLSALVHFLCVVAQHAQDYRDSEGEWKPGNKMDSNNLATLIAPNILHNIKPGCGQELSTEGAEERIDVINVVRSMIDHNDGLFTVSAELLDEVYVHMMDSHPDALDALLRKRDYSSLDEVDPCPTERELLPETEQVTRVWSREDFLHETAAMGGPDMSMSPRHSDGGKDRISSKKRYQTESKSSKYYQIDSKSVDTSSEDLSTNAYKEESSVITASLKIPVPTTINRDPEILFIEDEPDGYAAAQLTIGSPRRQHRSSSDSEVNSLDATEGNSTDWPASHDSSRQGESSKLSKGYQKGASVTTKELAPVILQKVTFTTTSELQQIQPKSASSSTKKVEFQAERDSERKLTSISSIGGAVMRSKTADIERMLNLQEATVGKSTKTSTTETLSTDKKNYAKRRYTDSRHPTRHIPDASSLQASKSSEISPDTTDTTIAARTTSRTGVVWKRRELIASDPK